MAYFTPPLFGFLFGSPFVAFAAMAGAVSIPIIIHLLNRKRFRVVVWAAMRFLLAAQRKNSRRLRLEQLILLGVRTLLVLLLVLAMASVMPWAEDWWHRIFPENAAWASSGSIRTHKVLVIDGSFSMGLKVGDKSCFDRARDMAAQIVTESGGGDAFSVVLMSSPARRVVPEPSEDARKVAAEIQNLKLPHGNADLAGTLNTVEDLLRQSPGKFEEREVYFLTDLQQSTWIARQQNLATTLQKIQAHARTIFLDAGHDGAGNLAVTSLTLGVPFATTGNETPITATVHNYSPDVRDRVRIELHVGKARATAADPPFALRKELETTLRLARGQNVLTFTYKFSTPGDYVVQVRIEHDNLEVDDTRSAVVTVKNTVPVMLVNGKPAAEVLDRATELLFDALYPVEAGFVPRNAPARPKVLSETQFADAGLGDLTPYDCVYLCDVARLSQPEIRRLETHLRRGGGVVISLGDQVDLGSYNEFLYRNGTGILPARLLSKQRAPKDYHFHFAVDGQSYRQPPLEAFGDDNDRASLVTARFRQYVRTELPPRSQARKILSFMPASSLARPASREAENLPVGDGAIIDWQPPIIAPPQDQPVRGPGRSRGRVLLVTTTLNTDWTTWPASPTYVPLMQELLRYAVSGRLREQALTVGDTLEEFLQTSATGLEAKIQLPDGRDETARTQAYDESSVLRWAATDFSGIYRLTIGNDPQEHLFVVNVPTATDAQQATESDLTRTNKEELHKVYPGWDFQLVTEPREVNHSGGTSGAGLERVFQPLGPSIAHWLLLGVLALLLVEVVLAWRFGHYSTVAGAAGAPPATGRWFPGLVGVIAGIALVALGATLAHAAWTGDFLGFLPDSFRRSIEETLGIPAPAPGEGSRWRLEFTSFLWDSATDPWLAGLVTLVAAGVVIWIYRQEGTTAGTGYKLLLAGVRMCFLLLTLAVLLPQLRLWFERQGWPDVVLLIDDSQSMSTADSYRDPEVQAVAAKLAQSADLAPQERLTLAQSLLTRTQPDWLSTLLLERKAKIHVYHCSSRAARISDVTTENQLEAATQAIQALHADEKNDSSQLGAAVRQVLNDFRGSSLSAVIMLTDGVTTEGEDLHKVSRYAAQVGVPLFFVGIGDSHETRDLEMHDLQVEDSVYVNDHVVFELRLTGHGFTDLTVPVRLREKGTDKVLDTQMVKIDPQGKSVKVRLKDQPKEPGEKVYVIDVPVQDGEKTADNNVLERNIFVRETKLIKVLYVEGYARYEFRFIKSLLERESARKKGNKSIDLKVLLTESDPDYAAEDKSALVDFPTKAELGQYDVIILGDVDPKTDVLKGECLKNLAEFVKEKGGGLLMIAGEHYAPHAYKDTPLRDILPIDLTADRQPDEPDMGRPVGYRPELTPVGRLHPIFRFSPDEHDSEEIWKHLRELYWWSEGYVPKRGAEVLAVRPRTNAAAKDRAGMEGQPLVVQQFVGSGRSLFFGFNESWRWRYREDELHFNQFWIQTVRYLARSRQGRVELRLDKQTPYRRGDAIKATLRFPDDAPPPGPDTDVKLLVERVPIKGGVKGTPEVQTLPLAKLEGSRATYEGYLTRTPEGEYRFSLTTPAVTGPKPRAECKVLAPPGEMEQLRMNQAEMERAAEETQGKFYTLATADRLLGELPSGTRVTLNTTGPPWLLWNHAGIFALAIFLLTGEWILRKRKHLL